MADDSCYLARSSPIGFAPQAGGTQNKTPVLALGRLARTATDGDAQLIPGIEQVLGPVGTRASPWAWALRGLVKAFGVRASGEPSTKGRWRPGHRLRGATGSRQPRHLCLTGNPGVAGQVREAAWETGTPPRRG